jgi:multiple sugar transport system permease protein
MLPVAERTALPTATPLGAGGPRKTNWRKITRYAGVEVLLICLAILFFGPFLWLISTSLAPESQVFSGSLVLVPHPVTWANYADGLNEFPFWQYFRNTVFICVFTVVGATASSSFVAYGFSRVSWIGRETLFVVVLATLILPYQVTLIPLYLLFKQFGWLNTYLPLIVPSYFGNAFFIFLFRQFYFGIPSELSDAARIDGCSDLTIYLRVLLPLSKPVLATAAIFSFIGAWSDFLGPLIYLTDASKYTLSIGVQQVIGQEPHWTWLMAVGVVMTLPILILFFFVQRTFIQGISFSGIKG